MRKATLGMLLHPALTPTVTVPAEERFAFFFTTSFFLERERFLEHHRKFIWGFLHSML